MKLKVLLLFIAMVFLVCVSSAIQYTDQDGRIHCVSDSFVVRYVDGDNVSVVSDRLHALASNDREFVRLVHLYISRNIRHVSDCGWNVKSPEKTILDLTRDCSEKSLLEVEMLTRHKIDAKVIHGIVPNVGLHDAVEVHLDHYVYRTDAKEQPTFSKIGDGLHPSEQILY